MSWAINKAYGSVPEAQAEITKEKYIPEAVKQIIQDGLTGIAKQVGAGSMRVDAIVIEGNGHTCTGELNNYSVTSCNLKIVPHTFSDAAL